MGRLVNTCRFAEISKDHYFHLLNFINNFAADSNDNFHFYDAALLHNKIILKIGFLSSKPPPHLTIPAENNGAINSYCSMKNTLSCSYWLAGGSTDLS